MRSSLMVAVALAAMIAVIASACGGGGHPTVLRPIIPSQGGSTQPPAEGQSISDYLDEQKASLPTWPSADTGAINGTLTVESYTLLDSVTLEPVTYTEGIVQVPLRVVDPEDDIDSIAFPLPDGSFTIPNLPELDTATLTVTVPVAEDVNGDALENDSIVVSLPVSVAAAKQTVVDITISPLDADALQEDALPGSILEIPPIQVDYHYSGPDGARQRSMALVIGLQRMLVDTNGDGKFGGEDLQFADENSNGQSDTSELASEAGSPASTNEVVEGTILSLRDRIITLRDTLSGASIEFEVTETTVIVDMQSSPAVLSPHIVGQQAVIQYKLFTNGSRVAELIIIDFSPSARSNAPHGPW